MAPSFLHFVLVHIYGCSHNVITSVLSSWGSINIFGKEDTVADNSWEINKALIGFLFCQQRVAHFNRLIRNLQQQHHFLEQLVLIQW
mmetsp:Transcript_34470/g.83407  ORF Transcript_34470/g.83407 Transcript_34470/m.83407 type:complete len:87 (-) Transcript_34470:17-277(-)